MTSKNLETKNTETKCSMTSLIGCPNAGKSTLLNHIVGNKVSIVTPKVQTTRSLINGITTYKDAQLIFVDTPGIFEPNRKLEKAMVKTAWHGIKHCEFICLLIDASAGLNERVQSIIDELKKRKIDPIILINKVDIASNNKVDLIMQSLEAQNFKNIFQISALTGKGLDNFLEYIYTGSPKSPWLYPENEITSAPLKFLASEVTREQLFLQLEEELPYKLTVETDHIEYKKDSSIKIDQVIIVEKDGHKQILLGKNGNKIKNIGTKARLELEQILERKIHLFLHVKIRKDWESNPETYRYMNMQLP